MQISRLIKINKMGLLSPTKVHEKFGKGKYKRNMVGRLANGIRPNSPLPFKSGIKTTATTATLSCSIEIGWVFSLPEYKSYREECIGWDAPNTPLKYSSITVQDLL